MSQKRSSNQGMKPRHQQSKGVGGRHRKRPHPTGGAGYLDIYHKLEPQVQKKNARDPRIAILKKTGLDWRWVRIAEQIGYEPFVQMWILMSELFKNQKSSVRSNIPHVNKLLRYQRDMMISHMTAAGDGPRAISDKLKRSMSIDISGPNISYIQGKLKK